MAVNVVAFDGGQQLFHLGPRRLGRLAARAKQHLGQHHVRASGRKIVSDGAGQLRTRRRHAVIDHHQRPLPSRPVGTRQQPRQHRIRGGKHVLGKKDPMFPADLNGLVN